VLATDHEYGACDRTWRFLSGKHGFHYIRQPISLPVASAEAIADQFWSGVTPRTRVIYLSHITSFTALRLPVAAICRRAREAGIRTIVDGAHAPGQIPVNVQDVGADYYIGNLHKWLMAPKGAAFLYAHPDCQCDLEPLIVSWGWEAEKPGESQFIDHHEWLGTHDPAAYLASPAAIRFQQGYDWPAVGRECHVLAVECLERIGALTGLPPVYPNNDDFFWQMFVAALPPCDTLALKTRLYDEFRIEVPILQWNEHFFVRPSIQGYNSRDDVDALLAGLAILLPQVRTG
jgi:isopenicillin-N epimerase